MSKEKPEKIVDAPEGLGILSLSFPIISYQVRSLEGDILTIADACTNDPQQRKAMKDLVKHHFRRKLEWMEYICAPDGNPMGHKTIGNHEGELHEYKSVKAAEQIKETQEIVDDITDSTL